MAQRVASCQTGPRPHSFALDRRVPEVGRQADRQAGSGTHTSIRKGGCWMSGSARKRRACVCCNRTGVPTGMPCNGVAGKGVRRRSAELCVGAVRFSYTAQYTARLSSLLCLTAV